MRGLVLLLMLLMQGVAGAAALRPQTPQAPFPWQAQELAYDSPTDPGVHLTGTLVLPEGKGPFPAVLLVTGSGQQDRDETLFGHKPFLVLADFLARHGIASLRVDDRGTGGSTGDVLHATSEDFARDARASLAHLRAAEGIDPARVGVIGHSEGGLIAAMLAAEPANQVAFVVMLAGPGLSGARILSNQVEDMARVGGSSGPALAAMVDLQDRLLALAMQGEEDPEALTTRLATELRKAVPALSQEAARARVATLASPWYRYFLATDPAVFLSRVRCPVLALNGSRDLQVRAADNLAAIGSALGRAGNPDVSLETLNGLNHLFQSAQTGAVSEYAQIEESFAPAALERVAGWIRSRAHGRD
ncbi:alpha/beta hydrolase family protein [Uliginosibacterium paludis]|uniref:Alpha/beta fold hydrolase n=1 Tax=Uliginosibacterium paludis TaxID=1615952 RepID=A0ABV2CPM8_9RHOO